MFKILLKKQLMEVFRSYFYNAKKNQKRSKTNTIVLFILYAVLMVGIIGGSLAALAVLLSTTLQPLGLGWMFYDIFGLVAVLLGVFGSVFNTYSGLYLAKDNDFLLAMPIPVKTIVAARLTNVLLLDLMYSEVVLLPAVIVYWICTPFAVQSILGGLAMLLVVPMIVLLLTCLLGWVVAKISQRVKNKSFVTVLSSLVAIGLYYFFYFKAQVLLRDLVENAVVYGEQIRGSAYWLVLFGQIGEGVWLPMLVSLAAALAALYATWRLLSHGFIGIATATANTKKAVYREKTAKQRTLFGAMLRKEFGRFGASASYILNCGFGVLFLTAGAVAMLLKGSELISLLNEVFVRRPGSSMVLLLAGLCMLTAMNDMATPSVSIEGKNLWMMQSMPIPTCRILWAKASVQLILTGIPALLLCCSMAMVLPGSPELWLTVAVFLLYVLFSTLGDLYLGLKMPNLHWTSEMLLVKQSGSVAVALFGNWGAAIAIGGLYLWQGWKLGAAAYLTILAGVLLVLSVVLIRWMRKDGSRIFENL